MAMDLHDHAHHHDHGRTPAAQPGGHRAQAHAGHGGHDHAAMIADVRRRFWVSAVLTVPVLLLSPMIQHWLGLGESLAFPGSDFAAFALSSIVFFHGGGPFLSRTRACRS